MGSIDMEADKLCLDSVYIWKHYELVRASMEKTHHSSVCKLKARLKGYIRVEWARKKWNMSLKVASFEFPSLIFNQI